MWHQGGGAKLQECLQYGLAQEGAQVGEPSGEEGEYVRGEGWEGLEEGHEPLNTGFLEGEGNKCSVISTKGEHSIPIYTPWNGSNLDTCGTVRCPD